MDINRAINSRARALINAYSDLIFNLDMAIKRKDREAIKTALENIKSWKETKQLSLTNQNRFGD